MLCDELAIRNTIEQSESIAFGCSHTWGVGVEAHEAWPYLLTAKNFGIGGSSGDLIVRVARDLIPAHRPSVIYCLWPDWSRFEYIAHGKFQQSLPTDINRSHFMATHDDTWCRNNFAKNIRDLHELCQHHGARLIDMTLYDLIPYIDHADQWPISKLGHHYAPEWHQWVAKIFAHARDTNQRFPLSYE